MVASVFITMEIMHDEAAQLMRAVYAKKVKQVMHFVGTRGQLWNAVVCKSQVSYFNGIQKNNVAHNTINTLLYYTV